MIIQQISIDTLIFFIGFMGVCLNYKNILISLVGIELMLLAGNLNFLAFSIYHNDIAGQVYSIFVLTTAAAESAVGLAILIIARKSLQSLELTETPLNK